VATDGCQLYVEVFNGRPGIYITGHVIPPLAGVNITVVAEKESQGGVLKEGATALWTVTGNDGSYVAGPLYDDATYSTHASLVCTQSWATFLVFFFVWASSPCFPSRKESLLLFPILIVESFQVFSP
jgi:hypothetical protein